jgi:hypothetical protein
MDSNLDPALSILWRDKHLSAAHTRPFALGSCLGLLPLLLISLLACSENASQGLIGVWSGTVDGSTVTLEVVSCESSQLLGMLITAGADTIAMSGIPAVCDADSIYLATSDPLTDWITYYISAKVESESTLRGIFGRHVLNTSPIERVWIAHRIR